jgi:hypothetical protein
MSDKPVLFTIHGIYTTGEWQKGVRSIMSWHFDCEPFNYREFRNLAILKLSADLLVTASGVFATFVLARHFNWVNHHFFSAIGLVLIIGFFVHLALRLRMSGLVDNLHRFIAEKPTFGRRPSVVAHSLGTHLVCSALAKFDDLRFATIILVAAVVKRRFPWSDMDGRIRRVFNEIGGGDLVPYTASTLGCTQVGMGCAGARGFVGDNVHETCLSPSEVTQSCTDTNMCCEPHNPNGQCVAKVHNIRHARLNHSTFNQGVGHARSFWLPILLGYDPKLYVDFYETCLTCEEKIGSIPTDFQTSIEKLRNNCWGWTTGGSLEDFTKTQILKMNRGTLTNEDIGDVANLAIEFLWKLGAEAVGSFEAKRGSLSYSRYLDPKVALKKSIAAALNESGLASE